MACAPPQIPEERRAPILILGLGNPLCGDDGIGPHVVELLMQHGLPVEVELLDGGTGGLEIALEFARRESVFVVDAARFGGQPGEFRRIDLLQAELPPTEWGAGHAHGLVAAIELARAMDGLPETLLLYAVEPKSVEPALPMSPEVLDTGRCVVRALLDDTADRLCRYS